MSEQIEQLVSETIELTGAAAPDLLAEDSPALAKLADDNQDFYLIGLIGGKDVGKSTIVPDGTPDDGVSTVDSPTVNDSSKTGNNGPLVPGHYCFRAEYTPDSTAQYSPGSGTNTTTECFTARAPALTITNSTMLIAAEM